MTIEGTGDSAGRRPVRRRATTEAGAVYECNDGYVRITPGPGSINWRTTIKLWAMMTAPGQEGLDLPWRYDGGRDAAYLKQAAGPWRHTDIAVVGEHLFVQGKDEWRISTLVVAVDRIEYDDE